MHDRRVAASYSHRQHLVRHRCSPHTSRAHTDPTPRARRSDARENSWLNFRREGKGGEFLGKRAVSIWNPEQPRLFLGMSSAAATSRGKIGLFCSRGRRVIGDNLRPNALSAWKNDWLADRSDTHAIAGSFAPSI